MSEDNAFSGSGYYFYDLTTKINYRISDKDHLYLSECFGRDVLSFSNSIMELLSKFPGKCNNIF